jgi:hypothetical protein
MKDSLCEIWHTGVIIWRTLFRRVDKMALLRESDAAPAFSVPNQDGDLITLDSHPGKTLVLWWYPMANTPG